MRKRLEAMSEGGGFKGASHAKKRRSKGKEKVHSKRKASNQSKDGRMQVWREWMEGKGKGKACLQERSSRRCGYGGFLHHDDSFGLLSSCSSASAAFAAAVVATQPKMQ